MQKLRKILWCGGAALVLPPESRKVQGVSNAEHLFFLCQHFRQDFKDVHVMSTGNSKNKIG